MHYGLGLRPCRIGRWTAGDRVGLRSGRVSFLSWPLFSRFVMNPCLSYRDERRKTAVASPPLSISVARVMPGFPFVRCGKNQWRGPRPAKGRVTLFRSIRLSDRQNDGVDIGARVGERPCGQIVPFHPAIGGAALLDDPMKGTVPLVVAKLRARAHQRNQYAAGFQEAEGMADMIEVPAPDKGGVKSDAVIHGT